MERTVSSQQTFLIKFLFPVVWISILLFVIFTGSNGSVAGSNIPIGFILLLIVAMIVVIYWLCVKLKRVKIFGNSLLVSNYMKEIEIPFSEVGEITENFWINIHPVTLHLKTPSAFGNKIVFMPKYRPFAFLSSHPVVDELKQLTATDRFR